jgi:NAD(P)-dependent dehydrogenase (short-subunit alcohol dehydrogenase family)
MLCCFTKRQQNKKHKTITINTRDGNFYRLSYFLDKDTPILPSSINLMFCYSQTYTSPQRMYGKTDTMTNQPAANPITLFDLSGKVALVTGGSRGIGSAIAQIYAQAGARVMIASRKLENTQPIADAINAAGGACIATACHTGDRAQVNAMVEQCLRELGRIDIVVNNAATNPHFGPLINATDEQWDKTLQVNVKGYFAVIQEAVPHMLKQGSGKIINVSSIAGITPGQMMGVYSVSKAAVIMLTQSLAQELGPQGIQANVIAPGVIQTKFSTALWSNQQLVNLVNRKAGRIGQPQDLAGVALFLASSASDYVNGSVMVVDGGLEVSGTF